MTPPQESPGTAIHTVRGAARWDGKPLDVAAHRSRLAAPERAEQVVTETSSDGCALFASVGEPDVPEATPPPRWNVDRRSLVLSRDPAGERALYWRRLGPEVRFASEPALLLEPGDGLAEVDSDSLLRFLLDADPPPEASFFTAIHRVPEGHQVEIGERSSRCSRTADADGPSAPWPGDDAERLLAALSRAVERRLPKDGRAGVLLSGGLDSTAIALLASERLEARGRGLVAFTWTSAMGDGIDETRLSRLLIASRSNVLENPIPADRLEALRRYPEAYGDRSSPEQPAYPDLLFATLESARRQGISVLLNGIGGDPRIGWLAPEMSLLLRGRFRPLARRWRGVSLRGTGLAAEVRLAAKRRALPAWLSGSARKRARELDLDSPAVPWRALLSRLNFRRYLVSQPSNATALERFDRLSRRAGIRIAAPWNDPELAGLVLNLPDCALPDAPPAKELLRRALAGRVPAPLLQMAKGNATPSRLRKVGILMQGRPQIESWLAASRLADFGLVEGAEALRAYRRDVERGSLSPRLWELLMAEMWLRGHGKI